MTSFIIQIQNNVLSELGGLKKKEKKKNLHLHLNKLIMFLQTTTIKLITKLFNADRSAIFT